ncbi:hypothetical protein GGX14DRAFT_383842 [Mycena pura]|uniref:Uncharacterized protein n=1 Tax=Mycena pura TaxID=153505 RepID=A0AAD6YU87_9AGAR|nr:hypothetical protein GGX14DRAFT_383842 [Mycena pura]
MNLDTRSGRDLALSEPGSKIRTKVQAKTSGRKARRRAILVSRIRSYNQGSWQDSPGPALFRAGLRGPQAYPKMHPALVGLPGAEGLCSTFGGQGFSKITALVSPGPALPQGGA